MREKLLKFCKKIFVLPAGVTALIAVPSFFVLALFVIYGNSGKIYQILTVPVYILNVYALIIICTGLDRLIRKSKIARIIFRIVECMLVAAIAIYVYGLYGGSGPKRGMAKKTLSRDEIKITKGAVWSWNRSEIKESGTYERFEYTTNTYDSDNKVVKKYANVYLPYGYNSDDTETKYDIMYLFHGRGGDTDTFMGSPEKPRDLKYMVDHLIQEEKMRPMIIVNATYYSDNKKKGEGNYDQEIIENYRNELIHDLIPSVEGKYHTYEDRDHRILAGFSMGSVMTISRMMDSMEYFRYYMGMSGSIFWSVHNTSFPDNPDGAWAGKYIADKIREQGYGKDDFYLYAAVGTLDFAQETVDKMIESMERNSDMFQINNETAAGNVSFWHGNSEEHSYHAKRRYLYNALPVFSALIHGKS